MNKFSLTVVVCLICTAALLFTADGRPPPQNLRCKCIQIYSNPPIPRNRIVSVDVIPAGAHCKTEQIIATIKKKSQTSNLCLNPKASWVIALKKSRKTTTDPPKSR